MTLNSGPQWRENTPPATAAGSGGTYPSTRVCMDVCVRVKFLPFVLTVPMLYVPSSKLLKPKNQTGPFLRGSMLEAYQEQQLLQQQHTEQAQHQQHQHQRSTLPSLNRDTTTTLLASSNQRQSQQRLHELDPRLLQMIILDPKSSLLPWLTDPDYIDLLHLFLLDETT